MRVLHCLFFLTLIGCARLYAQSPADEPCGAGYLTVNTIGSSCNSQTTFTINNSSNPNSYFTSSTSLSSGVNLPALSACGFTTGTNDFWYKITVPASGYFSIDLLGTNNNKYFDWIGYTSSNDAGCSGSVFTEVSSSVQCQPNTGSALTNVGPLTAGSIVYLRMWLHANINQASRATFILCVTQLPAPQPIPDCSVAIFPGNLDSVANNKITLQWQSAAHATDYLLFFRDSTEHESFAVLANSTNASFSTSILKYGHYYEWYVVPINNDGIANSLCNQINGFTIVGTPDGSLCKRATLLNIPNEVQLPVDEADNSTGDIDYGCLGGRNNARFYWFKVAVDGNVRLRMQSTSNRDFDYAVWGPFSSINSANMPCLEDTVNYSGFACSGAMGSPVSCDGSIASNLLLEMDTVHAGAYYLMMITNPSAEANTIRITPAAGNSAGYFSDCVISYFSAASNSASCSNNNYSIDYSISLNNPPAVGQLILADESGIQKTYDAPFASNLSGSLSGFVADGKTKKIQAYFTSNNACGKCLFVQPPVKAPIENECSFPLLISGSNGSGYLNGCTGNGTGELTDCGQVSCKTVYAKIHTQPGNGGTNLSLLFNGGNMGSADCSGGVRVSVYNDCNQPTVISPSCQIVNTSNAILAFSGLAPDSDYYLSFSPVNCSNNFCTWNFNIQGTSVLPVAFGAFTVFPNKEFNQLEWTLLSRNNIKRFEIYCKHNEEPEKLISVQSEIATSTNWFKHEHPLHGINIYRIKIVNIDGTFYWSKMIRVNNLSDRKSVFLFYPNPVRDYLRVSRQGFETNAINAELQIMDFYGRVVKIQSVNQWMNREMINVDFTKLSKGVYYLNVILGGQIEQTISIEKL